MTTIPTINEVAFCFTTNPKANSHVVLLTGVKNEPIQVIGCGATKLEAKTVALKNCRAIVAKLRSLSTEEGK